MISLPRVSEFAIGINNNKIIDRNKTSEPKVTIRPAKFNELKELWSAINQKYLLYYDKIEDGNYLQTEVQKLFGNGVFVDVVMSSSRQEVKYNDESREMVVNDGSGVQYFIDKSIPYNEFLKRINRQTKLAYSVASQCVEGT